MDPRREAALLETRRQLFSNSARTGLGAAALGSLLSGTESHGALKALHHPAKIKRVIYLFQSGAPSHLDLFDPKPGLDKYFDQDLPDSIRQGQRITGMTSGQKRLPVAPSMFKFQKHGKSGIELSELLHYTAKIANELCLVRSMHTEAINHDPAMTFIQTGSQQPGRPSMGAWLSYGLGSENSELPAFLVLLSLASSGANDQPLFGRLWGSGFLPSINQGVKLRSVGAPVLHLTDPAGFTRDDRRRMLDALDKLNTMQSARVHDPEIVTRIAQYEMAFKMQASVPDLMDLSKESPTTFERYGPESRKPGTFAANCLLARRLAERGVRYIQLYHRGWDQHGGLPGAIRSQCKDTDQPSAALVMDLKERGLLDDTLVIWGGEFGRTVYCQGDLKRDDYGRDHHGRAFSLWMAGGGIKKGYIHGATDDYGYNIVADPVPIHDLNATILHLLGIDHTRLTYRYQGRDYRLTDVEGTVVKKILA